MNSVSHDQHRKFVGVGLTVASGLVAIVITCVTWGIFEQSFHGWGWIGMLLAALAAIGLDGTLVLLVYGLVYAFVGKLEKGIAMTGLALGWCVEVMNLTVHNSVARGFRLTGPQELYVTYVGIGVLGGVALLLIGLSVCRVEALDRSIEREAAMAPTRLIMRKKLEWAQGEEFSDMVEQLAEPQMQRWLRGHGYHQKSAYQIGDDEQQPSATGGSRRIQGGSGIGFASAHHRPEGDDQGK